MVSLWWVTYPSGKGEEWSHSYGWPSQGEEWPHYNGWPTQVKKMENGLILMGDLPRKNDGLIMMGDLPKWKMMVSLWWVTYPDGKNVKCGLIIMGDLPRWKMRKMWSGLIVMGDLPKWKREVRSHYNGWPTQVEDRKNVKWSRYNGWPTHMEDGGLIVMGDLPRKMMFFFFLKMVSLLWVTYPKIECDLPGKKTWLEQSWQDKAEKLGTFWLQVDLKTP